MARLPSNASMARNPGEPTPDEIRQLCEQLRQRWDQDRLQRDERYQRPEPVVLTAAELFGVCDTGE